jgi:hypothetical protein
MDISVVIKYLIYILRLTIAQLRAASCLPLIKAKFIASNGAKELS